MLWHDTEEEYPTKESCYLVVRKGTSYIQVMCWNEHYQVWDDADGDDYLCDKESIQLWMEFPKLPSDFKIYKEQK